MINIQGHIIDVQGHMTYKSYSLVSHLTYEVRYLNIDLR